MTTSTLLPLEGESSREYLTRLAESGKDIDSALNRLGFGTLRNLSDSGCDVAAEGLARDYREELGSEEHQLFAPKAGERCSSHLERLAQGGVDVDGALKRYGFPPRADLQEGACGEAVQNILRERQEAAAQDAPRKAAAAR